MYIAKMEAWRIRRVPCVNKKRLHAPTCTMETPPNTRPQHPPRKPECMLCPKTTNQRTLLHPSSSDSVIPQKIDCSFPWEILRFPKTPRNLCISTGSFQTTTPSMVVFWDAVPFGEICSCYILLLGLGASQVVYIWYEFCTKITPLELNTQRSRL